MARNEPQVNLRMPQELKATLELSAKASNRSLTAEIIARLERSFETERFGLRGDLLEAMTMQSMLICLLYSTIDQSRLTEHERQMFETIVRHARKVTDNTLLSDDPDGPSAIVGKLQPGLMIGGKEDLQK